MGSKDIRLRGVYEAKGRVGRAEFELTRAVDQARADGVTWDQLADALGLGSRQSAQKWRARRH